MKRYNHKPQRTYFMPYYLCGMGRFRKDGSSLMGTNLHLNLAAMKVRSILNLMKFTFYCDASIDDILCLHNLSSTEKNSEITLLFT